MTTNECKTIRRELDEADPNQQPGNSAAEHLRGCSDCRAFASDQRSLRGLIATLRPVVAPSDFDFRLRARLAREKSRAQSGVGIGNFLKIARPVAVAALVLLVGVVGVVIKNRVTSSSPGTVNLPGAMEATSGTRHVPITPAAPANPDIEQAGAVATTAGSGNNPAAPDHHIVVAPKNRGLRISPIVRRSEGTATREFGVSPASVLVSDQADKADSVVRVPLDGRALQISIDDERGETRTILLPRVSFGSQRLVASQSFRPSVSQTKGVW